MVVSGLGLMAIAARSASGSPLPRRSGGRCCAVAVLSVTGWHLFSAFSLVHMGGGRGAIVAYTMPVWAALFGAWYLGERLDRRRLAALALGMLGIGAADRPGPHRHRRATRSGRC